MKKKAYSGLAAFALAVCLAVLACSVMVGCGEKEPPPEPDVESITLDVSEAKTSFEWGEEYTSAGLKVNAKMSDGTTREISVSDCAVTNPVWTTPGSKYVRVVYQGKSATYTVVLKDRVMPEIDKTPLFTVGGDDVSEIFTVEAENINLTATSVKAEDGKQLVSEHESASGGKYLGGYGVVGNYIGFAFTAQKAYENVTIVLRLANPSPEVLSLAEAFNLYLNYKNVADNGALDLSSVSALYLSQSGETEFKNKVIRNVALAEGVNTLSIDVLGANVPYIDKIEFYVGRQYLSDSLVEITEHKTYVKEFEDFDLEKVVIDRDLVDRYELKPGQVFAETPSDNLENTSGGKSVGGVIEGSEVSTVLRTNTAVKLDVTLAAAYPVSFRVKNEFEFYLDGVKLTDVEDKDIASGDYTLGQWWQWCDTYLGRLSLSAGDHLFTVKKIPGGRCNLDCFKFKVISGDLPEDPEDNHVCTHLCRVCGKCNDAECTHSACNAEGVKCECGHLCDDVCPTCGGCLTDCTEEHCAVKCECPENIDLRVSAEGEFYVEAEELDDGAVVTRYDAIGAVPPGKKYVVASQSYAHGGQKIHFLGRGSKFTIRFYVEEDTSVSISMIACGTYSVADNMAFTLDGETVEYTGDGNFSGNMAAGEWRTVKFMENLQLAKGVHTLTVTFLGCEPTDGTHDAPPDFDCFLFESAKPTEA